MTAQATGFTHTVVLNQRPTQPVEIAMPVSLGEAEMTEDPNGSLAVESDSGRVLVEAPRPLMWDSTKDGGGQPENVAPAEAAVTVTQSGGTTLTLSPDEGFLADPDTVYPVTVDPSFTTYATGDTWVQNADYTSSQQSSQELRAGTYDGGGHKARSFLSFNDDLWNGKHVTDAILRMRNFYSGSCTGAAIRAQRIYEPWTVADVTWANQPSAGSEQYDDFTPAHGYNATCDSGTAEWNLTAMVDDWAQGRFPFYGIRLKAVDETSIFTWRKYRSANYTATSTFRPRLVVTYNNFPNKADTPTVTPGNAGYATTKTPTIKAKLTDPDGGELRGKFTVYNSAGTGVWTGYSCTSIAGASCTSSGGTASVTVPAAENLADAATYTVKAWAEDATGDLSKTASSATTFKVDTAKPTATVTASSFTNGQWTQTVPASNTFTFNGPADTKSFGYTLDGVTQTVKTADVNGNATLNWLPKSGSHTVTVTPTDDAGNVGTKDTFTFGVGPASFTTPTATARSTGVFPIQVSGPPNATRATLSWRYAGKTSGAWTPLTGVTTTAGAGWTGGVANTGDNSTSTSAALLWDATAQEDPASTTSPKAKITAPALIDLQTCFTYSSTPSQVCSSPRQVQLVPSAFGGNFPVTQVGPATVALFTGEATLTEPDAVDTAAGVGRTFSSFDASTTGPGAFGSGWSTTLLAAGDTAAELVDHRGQDRTFVLVTAGGSSQMFTPLDPAIDPVDPTGPVAFSPTGGDDGSRLVLDGATVTLTRPLASVTTWEKDTEGAWVLSDAAASKASSETPETSFDFTDPGFPTWIAETEPGASTTCTQDVQEAGCRGLKITYTGTGVDVRVSRIERIAHGATPVTLAAYTYVNGLLDTACGGDPEPADPQVGPLCAEYDYTTIGGRTLLSQATPPGQKPWQFGYDATGRLTKVTRALDADTNQGTGPATWTVTYDLPPATSGLPDLSAGTAAQWGQTDLPTKAAAVFTPDHVPAATPTSGDLEYANLWYFDVEGTTTNTAVHGAGQWLVDTSWYDDYGNVIQTLDGAGRARALAAAVDERPSVASDASSWTTYNDDGDEDHDDGDGTRVEDEYGPVHTATLKDGTTGPFRAHTAYVYDDEAPTLGGSDKPAYEEGQTSFDLVVEARQSAASADMLGEYDATVVRNEYGRVVAGDGNGWELGTPTRVKTLLEDGSWSIQVTRFDAQGREIETRQPGGGTNADGSGNDAHATTTSYYSAGSVDPNCTTTGHADRAAWVGLACKTGPAGQPTGPTMPVTHYVDYDLDLRPTRVEETAGGSSTRGATMSYDAIGRPVAATVSIGTDTLSTTTSYDQATGLPFRLSGDGGTVTTIYDTWGQIWKYTDSTGLTSTTSYTPDGRVATLDDGEGTYTYTYDGTTGEHRRLPTSVDTGLAGGAADTFSLTYDAAGVPSSVTYPNGMVASYGYDELGVPTSLDYADGAGQILLAFTATVDIDGRVISNTSTASEQNYDFDALGRLTQVRDYRTNTDGRRDCDTRTYGFSPASERTSFASYAPGADGACQTTTQALSKINTYDTANRIRNTGYTYDDLGRTLTTPAADTAPGGVGPLTMTYFADDMVKSLTQVVDDGQGGTLEKASSYQLDPMGRINTITNQASGAETSRLKYRFSDNTDAPATIQTSTDTGASWTTTRYLSIPGLGMAGSITNGTLTLELSNLHGDSIATQVAQPGPAITIDTYNETDEYGNALSVPSGGRYGWLGTHQRSTDTVGGLTLMGARLYNPSTGQFLSTDPVPWGNLNRYTYPVDPGNQFDLTGAWCIGQVGTTCTRYVEDRYGRTIPIRYSARRKAADHNISFGLLKFLIAHASQYATQGDAVLMRYKGRQESCSLFGGCHLTGVIQWFKLVIDFRRLPHDGKTKGLVTAHCVKAGEKMQRCPDWVNS